MFNALRTTYFTILPCLSVPHPKCIFLRFYTFGVCTSIVYLKWTTKIQEFTFYISTVYYRLNVPYAFDSVVHALRALAIIHYNVEAYRIQSAYYCDFIHLMFHVNGIFEMDKKIQKFIFYISTVYIDSMCHKRPTQCLMHYACFMKLRGSNEIHGFWA